MISNSIPLGRPGTPDEIARAIVFLASGDSSFIAGIELFFDGGFADLTRLLISCSREECRKPSLSSAAVSGFRGVSDASYRCF
jgi:hypothetical protein